MLLTFETLGAYACNTVIDHVTSYHNEGNGEVCSSLIRGLQSQQRSFTVQVTRFC